MRTTKYLPMAALALFVMGSFFSCTSDEDSGTRHPNRRPTVRITEGAGSDSSGVPYRVTFRWHGVDDDGAVIGYQFAIDDTNGGGWRDTTATSATFVFRVGDALRLDADDPTRWHRFFVRSVDDDFAHSTPAHEYFNARTIAPSTRLHVAGDAEPFIQTCPSFDLRWTGTDPDGPTGDRAPAFFEYKLVRVSDPLLSDDDLADSLAVAPNRLLEETSGEDPSAWVRVSGQIRSVRIDEASFVSGAFAVRAVDEAGAREPELLRGRNVVLFSTLSDQNSTPTATLSESSLGRFHFPIQGDAWITSAVAGRTLRFSYSVAGQPCAGEVFRARFALDIPDPEDDSVHADNGVGGWTDWRLDRGSIDFLLRTEDGGVLHTLWMEIGRDGPTGVSRGPRYAVHMQAVIFTQDRFALWVDDARYTGQPNDEAHDAWLREHFLAGFHELGEVDQVPLFGSNSSDEPRAPQPIELPFSVLARYQNVLWNTALGSNTQVTGLFLNELSLGRLSLAARAGTRFLMFGGWTAATLATNRPTGNAIYPKTPPDNEDNLPADPGFTADSFLYHILRYRTWIVSVPHAGTAEQQAVSGMLGARAAHSAYPDLALDPRRWDAFGLVDCTGGDPNDTHCRYRGGLQHWEGLQADAAAPDQGPGFETLYEVETFNQFYDPPTGGSIPLLSQYDRSIVGHRYQSTAADTITNSAQPRIAVLGFDPYFFEDGSAEVLGRTLARWFATGRD